MVFTPLPFVGRWLNVVCVALLLQSQGHAQEWLGVTVDNYSPVNGMLVNPSSIADQKPWLDVHLAGLEGHLTNNVAYLQNSRVISFQSYGQPQVDLTKDNGWAQFNAQVLGPSASISLGKNAFGLHTRVRGAASINRIPVSLTQTIIQEMLLDSTVFSVNNMRVKTLAWGEIGASYARVIYHFDKALITGGITVNRLFGLQSAALFIDKGEMRVNGDASELLSGSGKYAFAQPAFTMGGGWSTSIGFTFKRMKEDVINYRPHGKNFQCTTLPYKWKVSASLVDIGGVRVKRGGLYNRFDENEIVMGATQVLTGTGDVNSLLRDGDRYTSWLPMGLNAQFDYNLGRSVFINAFAIQRLSLPSSFGPERSNLLAVTPRFETNWLMVALPMSIENYRKPHVGLAVRFWFLTIGTDQVIPYFVRTDVYTANIYAHLRIRFFDAPGCRNPYFNGLKAFKFGKLFNPSAKDPAACPHW